MSFIKRLFGGDADKAAIQASEIAANADKEALDYLKQREALPVKLRDEALQGLAGYYQMPSQPQSQEELYQEAIGSPLYAGLLPGSQEELLAQAEGSPLYSAIMSGRKQGEESILRNASATGGLRSGGTIEGLADYNTNLRNTALLTGYGDAQNRDMERRQALLQTYGDVSDRDAYGRSLNLTGLSGLAGMGGNENAIAQLYSSIGGKKAAGVAAAGQAKQDYYGNILGTIMTGAQIAYSDIRMKKNVRFVKEQNGHNWYEWDWNEVGNLFGLEGHAIGVLAHEVFEKNPDAVGESGGYITVDYAKLEAA